MGGQHTRLIPPLKGEGADPGPWPGKAGGVMTRSALIPHPARYARHPPPTVL
jgi:hypothetical protein